MILVSGATGQIGRRLVKNLIAMEAPVRALVRSAEKGAELEALGAQTVLGDFDDPESLEIALIGVSRFFVLSPPGPALVAQQTGAIRAARDARVRHLVKLSALGANPDSPIRLTQWHGTTDAEVERSGLPWTILRPASFMENLLIHAPTIAAKGEIYGAAGDGKFAVVDTRDIADVAVQVLTGDGHEGKTYEITGPAALSYAEMAAELSKARGKRVRYVNLSADAFKTGLVSAGLPEWLAGDLAQLESTVVANGHAARVTDTVPTVAGHPARSFAQFVADHAGAFRKP